MGKAFAHIVNRQARDTGGGKRFHFHSRLSENPGFRHHDRLVLVVQGNFYAAIFQGQGMTKRNERIGSFGGLNSGQNRGVEYGSLGQEQVSVLETGCNFLGQIDNGSRLGDTPGRGFGMDVHHGGHFA